MNDSPQRGYAVLVALGLFIGLAAGWYLRQTSAGVIIGGAAGGLLAIVLTLRDRGRRRH